MKHNVTTLVLLIVIAASTLAACDNGPSPQPTALPTSAPTAQATPQPTLEPTQVAPPTEVPTAPTIVDAEQITPAPTAIEDNPSPTAVTATGTGVEMTALQALALLEPKALAWQPDVRLAILADTRPGQQTRLLGSALGDPDIFEATPGGKGRNWTLVAVSPARGAFAVSMDGTQVDLSAQGVVSNEMLGGFSGPSLSTLDLATLDLSGLVDSDTINATSPSDASGTALIAPDGLGIGPLPTPQVGGAPPKLAYQTFSTDPARQSFTIYDAFTGAVILDSSKP